MSKFKSKEFRILKLSGIDIYNYYILDILNKKVYQKNYKVELKIIQNGQQDQLKLLEIMNNMY